MRTYLVSFAGILGLGFLLAVSLVISTSIAALSSWAGPLSLPMGEATNFAVSLAILTALFAMLFKWFPDAEIAWRDVLPGAVVTASLFNVGKMLIGWYIGTQGLESTYGAAASIVVAVDLGLLLRADRPVRRGDHACLRRRVRLAPIAGRGCCIRVKPNAGRPNHAEIGTLDSAEGLRFRTDVSSQEPSMPINTMDELFVATLKDIYYAEKQILKALPGMVKKAKEPELKKALEAHREETEGQVSRLEQVFKLLDHPARGKKCDAIEGIIAEAKEHMEEIENDQVLDAGMISSAQAVEHYEICRYGTLIEWAKDLGHDDAIKLLQQTLDEEKNADKLLSKIAKSSSNRKAMAAE